EDHSGEAFSLNNLGRTYRRSGADDLAIKAYQQALMIWREINNSLGEAVSLRLLGDTYRSQYQYESAIDIYQQLVVVRRLINDPFGEATALIHLGVSYKDSGQYQQAINSYQQALAIANNIGDRENASGALGNLANAYSALGNSQQAMEAYQKSLNIAREIGDREGEAITLNALGNLYTNLGQYRLSLDAYEQAILIHREINNRHGEANSLNSLGALYDLLGREQLAAELYEQSLLISQEVDDKAFEALTLSNLANINPYSQQSMDYRLRNREIIIEIEDPIGTARYFLNLGNWYLRNPEVLDFSEENFIIQPRFPQAIEAYQISLARYRALGLRGEEAHLLAVLGHTYLKLAQFDFSSFYQMAIDRYEESLAISREAMLPLKEANALSGLANAYIYAGNHTGAENVLIEVLTILDSLREGDLDDTNKIALFETQIGIYESLKSILLSQNRYEEALVASERARSRVLVEALSSRTLPQAQGEMANETSDLASIRHVARQQNATLVTYSKGNGIVRMWVVQPSGEITFKSVQVAPDVPRVETVETESGALETRAIPSEHPDLNELIIDSRQAIGVRGDRAGAPPQLKPEEIARRQAEQDEKLSQLHDILIDPIADLLPDDPNQPVVFIPQGELFLVPFPALKDDNGDYLIENHTILTAPSIQVLQLTHDIAASRSAASTDNPVIVGNPTMPTVTFLSEAGNFEDVQLNPLFGAQQEAQAVAEFLDAPALIGADATEAAVKQQIASADLIHLATHGLLEYGDPRETGSRDTPGAIALAPGSGEDGLLTSSEILQMDLQADLVVLSACDTGRGRITGDGVIGLSRSFVAAGVPSIIVSLWAVPDAPTADLMTEFYQQRDQGQTKAQALRQAMLITMQTHPDPRDWAAFTLIGESE
ncbi:MAG: CHAT domain-containing tetratricopeptide repeat protein, partial [Cyanobacteria bacterium P01_D01_bin.115]